MRLGISSDQHLEFVSSYKQIVAELEQYEKDVDVHIIAGDLLCLRDKVKAKFVFDWFSDHFNHVLYIKGNHCSYGSSIKETEEIAINLAKENFHVLGQSEPQFHLEGLNFIGNTLWFPYQSSNSQYERYMTDFQVISDIQSVYQIHEETKKRFWSLVDNNTILVTHHLPSHLCTHPKYVGSYLNRFFVGDIEDLILEKKPRLQVHGHSHEPLDIMIGSTRVIRNPVGYAFEGCKANKKLVIEIE